MEGFNHILLAFDGSDSSVDALKTAEQLTKLSGALLTVAYVHDPSAETSINTGVTPRDNPIYYYTSTYVGAVPAPREDVYHKNGDTPLQDNTPDKVISDARLKLSNTVKTDFEVLSGKPADELIKFAKEKDMDLIIMGNRGVSGIKKLVTGSVSKKVLDEADCPVLVVK